MFLTEIKQNNEEDIKDEDMPYDYMLEVPSDEDMPDIISEIPNAEDIEDIIPDLVNVSETYTINDPNITYSSSSFGG